MARWSSGQDGGLSRRKQEFDSPTGHHNLISHWLLVRKDFNTMTGADDAQAPPVPIPNTEVKLGRADNTWMATSREDR